jgi:hypothetical protein
MKIAVVTTVQAPIAAVWRAYPADIPGTPHRTTGTRPGRAWISASEVSSRLEWRRRRQPGSDVGAPTPMVPERSSNIPSATAMLVSSSAKASPASLYEGTESVLSVSQGTEEARP